MSYLINNIINSPSIQALLENIYSLSSTEISVIIFAAAVLMLCLAYRLLGIKMVFVLLLLYLIIYVLCINDIFSLYNERVSNNERHMQAIEHELEIK